MTSAIVDVGHIVATHALAAGDRGLALCAAQVAYTAAPYDEVAQLDMVQTEKSDWRRRRRPDQDLNDKVFNRRDDELPPMTFRQRTARLSDHKDWGSRGPTSSADWLSRGSQHEQLGSMADRVGRAHVVLVVEMMC